LRKRLAEIAAIDFFGAIGREAAEGLLKGLEAQLDQGEPMASRTNPDPGVKNLRQRTWVTREGVYADRIASAWLIRRFIDPRAVFLFVTPSEVDAVAERFTATPFDVEGVFWSHRGEKCTFDVMVEEFGLITEPMQQLAAIVRGADTGRFEVAPQSAGLLAASLGLSRMYSDDLAQLEAGMTLYDAFYRWCRDATDETHTWHSKKPGT
jgi:hypothetical protein